MHKPSLHPMLLGPAYAVERAAAPRAGADKDLRDRFLRVLFRDMSKRGVLRLGSRIVLALACTGLVAQPALAQPATRGAATRATTRTTTGPATQAATVTVMQVVGTVDARQTADDKWTPAKVGQVFDEGVEFRTGIRSQVLLRIPPDQEVRIDRLTTLRVLRATMTGNRAQTDLGMRYGRTQYNVEEAGVEHEATIRSPGATLAVRGTESMRLTDHGPFPPTAVAWQPVEFRNLRRQVVRFGREGRPARIDGNKSSPAETEVARADVDPRTEFSGRTPQEDALTQYLANFPGVDLKNLGIFGVLASEKNFKGNLIGVLPTPAQLRFILVWTAPFGTDVDLSVRSPLGEVVSIDNPQVKSSGRHLGDGVANKNGLGQETVIWEQFFPPGNYTVRGRLQDKGVKGTVGARLFVDKNPGQKDNQQLDDFSVDLSSKSPAFRRDVKAR